MFSLRYAAPFIKTNYLCLSFRCTINKTFWKIHYITYIGYLFDHVWAPKISNILTIQSLNEEVIWFYHNCPPSPQIEQYLWISYVHESKLEMQLIKLQNQEEWNKDILKDFHIFFIIIINKLLHINHNWCKRKIFKMFRRTSSWEFVLSKLVNERCRVVWNHIALVANLIDVFRGFLWICVILFKYA